jgi:uncharacterized 2Fe-2S/4Fe-4S cluster protein (DUF4445 family)
MYKITIKSLNKTIICEKSQSIAEALVNNDISINISCMRRGTCGKCKIRHISGRLNDINSEESKLLSNCDVKNNIRLACYSYPEEDIEIDILVKNEDFSITSYGFIPSFKVNPSIYKLLNESENTYVYFDDEMLVEEDGNTLDKLHGIAVDIGTTTVVMSLIDVNTSQELASELSINTQIDYGQDIISRISYTEEKGNEGIIKLQKTIVNLLNDMLEKLCIKANIDRNNIYEIDISANTAMLHMLLGINATAMTKVPYEPAFTASQLIAASELGININANGKVYCLPSISAFVGADIVAGLYASDIFNYDKNLLYMDIGTNGEMVIKTNDKMYSCSCAAGPALEGMNISFGMKAGKGAIEQIKITENDIDLSVIGEAEPAGICGSGIISTISQMLEDGLIKKDGSIQSPKYFNENNQVFKRSLIIENERKKYLRLNFSENPITISQKDIRQVQLAKAAILAGVYTLLQSADIKTDNISRVIIAGQFGLHLSVENLVGCGILPSELSDKITYVGNASKSGACMSLLSRDTKAKMNLMALKIEYIDLSKLDSYQKLFIDCLKF